MIRTNLWTPDTCGCTLEFQWDDAEDASVRAHVFSRSISACQAHAALRGHANHWDTVLEENRRKNLTWGAAREAVPGLSPDDMTWTFDANRVLTVNFGARLTNNQKAALRARRSAEVGAGKVIVT